MFAHRRPGRARAPRSRGVPGDRPGRHDRRARQVGGRARPTAADVAGGPGRGAPPGRSAVGRDRSCCRSPRTCSTSSSPTTRGSTPDRPARRDPPTTDIRDVIELLASAERPGHPRRRRRPAGANIDRPAALRRAAPGPGRRRLATGRRHLERPSAVPRHGRPRRRRRPSASGSPRPTRCWSSAAGSTSRRLGGHDPGRRDALGARRHRAAAGRRAAPAGPARSPPTRARSCAPRTSASSARAVLDAEKVRRRGRRNNADGSRRMGGRIDRRCRRRRLDGPGRPSRPGHHDAARGPARRRDPHDRRRQLRRLGRPRLPVPTARHVPRADLRRDGLRASRRRSPRPSCIATDRSSPSPATVGWR